MHDTHHHAVHKKKVDYDDDDEQAQGDGDREEEDEPRDPEAEDDDYDGSGQHRQEGDEDQYDEEGEMGEVRMKQPDIWPDKNGKENSIPVVDEEFTYMKPKTDGPDDGDNGGGTVTGSISIFLPRAKIWYKA